MIDMSFDQWIKVTNPWVVIGAAVSSDRARDAAVVRIIDTMLELQLDCRHENPGYQPFSVAALAGELPGGGGRSDQAMLAAMRYHPESQWHRACGLLLDQLPRRQAAAMLMQAARVRPEKAGASQWMVTARQMVERQGDLLRALGLNERVRHFESVNALQHAARRARNQLSEWLAQGEVSACLA
ncbi:MULTISPECIES: hypothetical protein [unclassified Halomonas]|uniref:hypothetical protein n=1 Tax=unclassified Halomonas TaxID=2609666 RepID=UPI0020A0C7C7|nr:MULTISPECIES: hypothetical protein [unclassified Halomonas]MCP1312994.1 hypothetical protein [Halomonas sp. 707D7]MCP1326159.1 hypothetical protein [Halomonas sp. 707D4]